MGTTGSVLNPPTPCAKDPASPLCAPSCVQTQGRRSASRPRAEAVVGRRGAAAAAQGAVPRGVGRRHPHDQPRRCGRGRPAGPQAADDEYKSGKFDRAKAFPQGSPWCEALARTLMEGAAAADQYDADKVTDRKPAAQCRAG